MRIKSQFSNPQNFKYRDKFPYPQGGILMECPICDSKNLALGGLIADDPQTVNYDCKQCGLEFRYNLESKSATWLRLSIKP